MHLRLPIVFALFAAALEAQLASPRPGFVRLPGQAIQSLYGIPGNLVPGPSPFGAADAISFSDGGGLLARDGRVELVRLDGTLIAAFASHESAPLLNIDRDLSTAVAWLPEKHGLLWWNGKALSLAPVHDDAFGGSVTSVSLSSSRVARFLIAQPGNSVSAVEVNLADGELVSSDILPGVRGPAFQVGSSVVWVDETGLHIENPGRAEQVLAFPAGPFTATRMSSGWIHLSSIPTGTDWALHLDSSQPTLSRIPGQAGHK